MANIYVYSAAAGAGTGADWANAYVTIGAALAAAGTAAGDNIWVAHDHAESTAGAVSWTDIKGTAASPINIACVNRAGSVPPVSADLRTTAVVATTGANSITLNTTASRAAYIYGITFSAGSGAVTASIVMSSAASMALHLENCTLSLAGTSGGGISGNSSSGWMNFRNVNVTFASAAQTFTLQGQWVWEGGTFSGTMPATLFAPNASTLQRLIALDLSAAGAGKTLYSGTTLPTNIIMQDCKLHASVTLTTRATHTKGGRLTLIRCDSGETAYRTEIAGDYSGDMQTSTTVVRTGGASDGTTPISWKLTTTANSEFSFPFIALPVFKFNETIDENIGVTIEGVADPRHFSALPTNKEIWFDLEYQGTNGSPLGVYKSGTVDFLASASALTASTEAWDSAATARANTTAYSLGDVIKVATNPGRIFVCTTVGTTAGSEPAGYASAVDGGAVTDNTAVFTAAWRFKQTITTTAEPRVASALQAVPKMAKASSVLYLDPKLVVAAFLMGGSDFLTDGVTRLLAG